MSSNSSCQSIIDEIREHCERRLKTADECLSRVTLGSNLQSYIIGQISVYGELRYMIDNSSHTTKIGDNDE